jgi:hypothetical protein
MDILSAESNNAAMRELHVLAYAYFSTTVRCSCCIFEHDNATPSLMAVGDPYYH